ncbi:hypothetical protein [Vineibacter terrae]|uniref:hypothetical protein n=1 Tax=Vineibacter terrae TaxID=2586908 RepID=UPI002E344394|nr:hypothetical protein [Vineibacter terrae]HEX2890921.1 hypothetical protein [Vineibacter terrae]
MAETIGACSGRHAARQHASPNRLDSDTLAVVGAGMIGRQESTRAHGRLLGRLRRLVSILCALALVMAAVTHVSHAAFAASPATPAIVMDATDDGQEPAAKERLLTELCHCCAMAALPVSVTGSDRGSDRTLPVWIARPLLSHRHVAESPPPRI